MALLFATPALARPEPVLTPGAEASPGARTSYSIWAVDGSTVRLRVMVSAAQAQALVGPNKPRMRTSDVADAVSQSFSVSSPSGDCPAVDQGEGVGQIYTMAITPGLDRFEIIYACQDTRGIVLHDKFLFDKTPGHVDLARIQVGSAAAVLAQFTRDQQSLATPPKPPSLMAYAKEGAARLLRRPEALGLIAALLLLALRWRDLGWIAAGIGGGYGLALIASALTMTMPRPPLAAAATGLLAAAVAAAGLRRQSAGAEPMSRSWRVFGGIVAGLLGLAAAAAAFRVGNLSLLATAGLAVVGLVLVARGRQTGRAVWLILVPAALMGLLDGLGPVSDLAVLNLTWKAKAAALIGEMAGAAVAAVALATVAMGLLWLAGQRFRGLRKPASDLAGAALIGLGVFWFVSRLYS